MEEFGLGEAGGEAEAVPAGGEHRGVMFSRDATGGDGGNVSESHGTKCKHFDPWVASTSVGMRLAHPSIPRFVGSEGGVRKMIEEPGTSFEERGFRGIPVDGFERQSLKPKVIKFFTRNQRVMREGSTFSIFDKVGEKF